jgi:hypothetical protein
LRCFSFFIKHISISAALLSAETSFYFFFQHFTFRICQPPVEIFCVKDDASYVQYLHTLQTNLNLGRRFFLLKRLALRLSLLAAETFGI